MVVVISPSNIEATLTMNVLDMIIINFGVQQKWMQQEDIMDNGRIVMKVALGSKSLQKLLLLLPQPPQLKKVVNFN